MLIHRYFYVVALKLQDGEKPLSSDNYKDYELVTYTDVKNVTTPYVAAIFKSRDVEGNTFILGDGRYTDDPISRTTNDYLNGPLEPGSSYIIFQRVIINEQVL